MRSLRGAAANCLASLLILVSLACPTLGFVAPAVPGNTFWRGTTAAAAAPSTFRLHVASNVEGETEIADTSSASSSTDDMLTAVKQLDAAKVSALLESGSELDESTTDAAFWAVVSAVDAAEAADAALPPTVPRMLHHIFDADIRHLSAREQHRTNVTCMQPKEEGLTSAAQMNYIFDDSSHKDLPLTEGRRCEDGRCCAACSRNIYPTFATAAECSLDTFPDLASLTFNNLANVPTAAILQFARLVERVRRSIAAEYGLPLSTVLPLQAYARKYVAGTTQQGGGGGEGDFVTLHTDEATHAGYHYSSVLYLSTQGEDFEGGDFVFNDPLPEEDGSSNDGADAEDSAAAAVSMEEEAGRLDFGDGDDDDDDDDEAAAEALFAKLMAGEDLPDDDEEGSGGGGEILSSKDLVDNEWGEEDVEEYEDLEYFTDLKDKIRRAGRRLTPFHPTRGAAVVFSSGWENMHEVESITSGVRYAVPCFFTTSPVPDVAYEQMVQGRPKTDEDIADDWLHLLLAHREGETPQEGVGRVKELLMKWHMLCAPLTEH